AAVETNTTGKAHRGIEWSLTLPIFHIEFCSAVHEELNDIIQSPECGAMHGCLTATIGCIDIDAGLQTKLNGFDRFRLSLPTAGRVFLFRAESGRCHQRIDSVACRKLG